MTEVRVRFAPSPTGPLHIGGVRTALYNYLFAKNQGGKFVLRVEDTDQVRYMKGSEQYISNSLKWLGIYPDESPEKDGNFGPYRQSERLDIYKEHALKLIETGKAYYAFDTPEEIESMKKELEADGVVMPQYNSITRNRMRNSLTLSGSEVEELMEEGVPYVIRLKMPSKKDIRFKDRIRDWVKVHSSTMDDKVLMKSDGFPTYHLANIVDDHLMKITHVIRGEEWLPSAPLHVYLYECFGWEHPEFAHLPLLLKPTGKGKLSKRDSKKYGFPVFPMDWKEAEEHYMGFMEAGYLPEAVLNFLAFLGWNPGGEKEIFSLTELIEEFRLERIGKGGARFDIEKAKWYNEFYLRNKPIEELTSMVVQQAKEDNIPCDETQAEKIALMMKERVQFPRELINNALYLFNKPESYNEKVVRKKWNADCEAAFSKFANDLENMKNLSVDDAKSKLNAILEDMGIPMGKVMQALRVALTGEPGGPDLFSIIEFLGPKEVAERLTLAIEKIPIQNS